MSWLLFGSASLAGGAVWWWLLRRLPAEDAGLVRCEDYRVSDAVFASTLGLGFLLMIFSSGGAERSELNGQMFQAALMFWVMLLSLTVGFMIYRGLNPVGLFGLWPKNWRWCAGVGLAGIAAVIPVILLIQKVVSGWFPEAEGDRTVEFLRERATAADWATVVVMAVVVAPVVEEVIFRGYLYGVARRFGGRWAAVGVTALLFAAIHVNALGLVPLALLGVVFALAYELTGSLWTSVLMHVCFNGLTLVVLAFFPGFNP